MTDNKEQLFNKITATSLADQNLIRLLGLLAERDDLVVWMRTPDYRQQLYLSPAFEKIWGCSAKSMFEAPLTWTETLVDEEKDKKIRALCARNPISDLRQRHTSYFRIHYPPAQEIRHIRDTCFYLANAKGVIIAIAGVSEWIDEHVFDAEIKALSNTQAVQEEHVILEILQKLDNENKTPNNVMIDNLPQHYIFMRDGSHVGLTTREHDTLKELIHGKSTKEIARALSLSPRTVDDYVENIKYKLQFQKKSELFQRIHPAYLDFFLMDD